MASSVTLRPVCDQPQTGTFSRFMQAQPLRGCHTARPFPIQAGVRDMISTITAVALRVPAEVARNTALAVLGSSLDGIWNTCPADGSGALGRPVDDPRRAMVAALVPLALGTIYTVALGAAFLRNRAAPSAAPAAGVGRAEPIEGPREDAHRWLLLPELPVNLRDPGLVRTHARHLGLLP